MKLSIILPLYNGANTLERTLNSVLIQNFFSFNDYEIIIVNDSSIDDYLSIIARYSKLLPIVLINVNLKVHCAGNSRQIGLNCARGEWITFIDQDDEFLPNAFKDVFSVINTNKLEYICCTLLYEFDESTKVSTYHTDVRDNIDVWLHGKYYNRVNLIEKYNIQFKKNLKYLEDLYFNNIIITKLCELGVLQKHTFVYYDILTYRWIEHNNGTHNKLVKDKYYFNHYGVATQYCDIVFPCLIKTSNCINTDDGKDFNKKMIYSDIAYLYFNFNILRYSYGESDIICKKLLKNLNKYLKQLIPLYPITDIYSLTKDTIDYLIGNCEALDKEKIVTVDFMDWWYMVLSIN